MFKTKSGFSISALTVFVSVAITVLCALYGFGGMFDRVYVIFAHAHEEDMSFGWFVPIFSLYVLWTKRDELIEAVCNSRFSWLGLILCIPFLGISLLGTRGVQLRLEQLGFIGLCVTLPWTFFGWRMAKLFLFPAFYLLFCIPLATFLDFVTIQLRYLASATSLAVLNGIGLEAVREGTAVISRGAHPFAVDIAEPCSGLRSLFALMALTAGYAYFNQPTWFRRALLFLCSIPLAILGNVARIVSICVIASCTDPQFATGFYHDYSGYIVFIVAISLMVVAGGILDRIFNKETESSSSPRDVKNDNDSAVSYSLLSWMPKKVHMIYVVCATLLFAGIFVFQAKTPPATIAKAPDVRFSELSDYTTNDEKYAEQQKVSEGELTILPKDTRIIKKMYESRSGAQFLASFVVGGTSRASIHRPELCLPSQGYVMSNPRNFDVGGRPWHVINIAKPGGASAMEAYTFFNQEGFRTASHTRRIWQDVIDRSVLNRVDRWVMLTVHALGANEAELLEFLKAMGDFE
jgi:exosortase